MPPKGSGKAKEGLGRSKAASTKATAKAAAETVPAKKGKAASSKHPVVFVGTRVRVQCADGEHYEGNVDSWDAAAGEWKIVLDDGGPPLPPHLPPAPACLSDVCLGAALRGVACGDGAARAIKHRR